MNARPQANEAPEGDQSNTRADDALEHAMHNVASTAFAAGRKRKGFLCWIGLHRWSEWMSVEHHKYFERRCERCGKQELMRGYRSDP